MKVEVQFLGSSIAVDTYEGEHINWTTHEGQLAIYVGTKDEADRVATYPESRVVRVRVIE
jgi:hypothetical protein